MCNSKRSVSVGSVLDYMRVIFLQLISTAFKKETILVHTGNYIHLTEQRTTPTFVIAVERIPLISSVDCTQRSSDHTGLRRDKPVSFKCFMDCLSAHK